MKAATIITKLARLACAAFALAAVCATARAQQGPQDSWTYYGVQFSSPTPANNLSSIAIGSGGVYVGEWNSGNPTKVLRFTEAGTFVSRFNATFTYIIGLACDSASNVYVFDAAGPAIAVKVFDQSGTFLRQWGGPGTGDGQFRITFSSPTMIAIDRNDHVYVAESGNSRVEVFDTNGTFLRKWGQLGSLPGQFPADYPSTITVSNDGRVYAERDGYGMKVFDTNGGYLHSRTWQVFAASSDGLIFIDRDNPFELQAYKVGDASQLFSTFLQPPSGVRPVSKDAAFSKRGDLFCVSGATVSVFKRE